MLQKSNQESKTAKIRGTISKEDIFMPNLRKIMTVLEQKMARNSEQIDKQTMIIKSKLRAKAEKQHILRYLKEKKKLEKQNQEFLDKLHNMESIVDTYRNTQDNLQMIDVLEVR